MAEYIERDHLLAAFSLQDYPWVDVDDYYEIAQNIPAADVVEVVRCKDCRHLLPEKMLCTHEGNMVFGTGKTTYSNCFCSYGERKIENEVQL